jgi:hypothetical protein
MYHIEGGARHKVRFCAWHHRTLPSSCTRYISVVLYLVHLQCDLYQVQHF